MKKYKINITLDYIHTFIRNSNFSHAIWISYLLYKGFNPIHIGIFETIFHITSLTMEVPTGLVADMYGRKRSRVIGILLFLLYIVIMITSTNFFVISLGFVLCGLSYTFESGSGEALVYDSLKLMGEEDRFMKINGRKEVIYQAASSIALAFGGYLSLVFFELPFLVTFTMFTLALFTVFGMIETPLPKSEKKTLKQLFNEQYVKTTKTVIENKRLFLLILIGALFFAPVTSLFMFFQGYIQDLGYDRDILGYLLAAHSVFGAVGGVVAFRLEKKLNEKLLLYIIPTLITLMLWLVLIDTIVFIPFVLLGFFDSLMFVVLGDYINRLIPSNVRASVLSVSGFAFSFVMIILFPIIGVFGHYLNLKSGFLFLAIIVTVFNIVLWFILKGNHLINKEETT